MSEQRYQGKPMSGREYRESVARMNQEQQDAHVQAEAERAARVAAQSNGQDAEVVGGDQGGDFNPGVRADSNLRAMPDVGEAVTRAVEFEPDEAAALVFAPQMVQQIKVAGMALGAGIFAGITVAYLIRQARTLADQGGTE